MGRSRAGLNTRTNALAPQGDLPLRIVLSAGQAPDKAAVEVLVDGLKPTGALVAHRGYDIRGGEISSSPAGRLQPLHPGRFGRPKKSVHRRAGSHAWCVSLDIPARNADTVGGRKS